jgi:hypothetical protein
MLVIFICLRTIQGDQAAVKNGDPHNCNSNATANNAVECRNNHDVQAFFARSWSKRGS